MKRAYKLQEFVAHSSQVNCLKIGRRTSRVLVTGGDDHKVNMWAIGKPNAILTLSGHSSSVESVTFDGAESHVVAGAASGALKLWDLEEAKIVRTLSGHRSNCKAVDFHPFGEFFASGSQDSNLKIWDVRRKGCIHTYKGHARGVNCLKFSPDGRWVVSGGEDNVVKLWDLTAGKLIHDFKCHRDQILCLDFHPHEFLLAAGSDDRTTKLYDLETFELVGSAGPENTGVRSMVFSPDGRALLTAMEDNLKVYSWEPLRCHDTLEVSWSQLADLNVHDGKLLGCSFNQSCVGVWVVDIARVAPFRSSSTPAKDVKTSSNTGEHVSFENVKTPSPSRDTNANHGRRSSHGKDNSAARLNLGELSPIKESSGGDNSTRASVRLNSLKKSTGEQVRWNDDKETECETPTADRHNRIDQNIRGDRNNTDDSDMPSRRMRKAGEAGEPLRGCLSGQSFAETDSPRHMTSLGASTTGYGRPWSSSLHRDKREDRKEADKSTSEEVDVSPPRRGGKSFFVEFDSSASKRSRSGSEDDIRVIDEILQERATMTATMQSRLAKLQVVRRFWMKKDLKSVVETMAKMGDKSVLVDGLSVLIERSDVFSLEIAAMFLPLLNGLLSSETKRHVMIAIAFTGMLVRNFGHVINETLAASPTLGVDLQAERRVQRCDICLKELRLFKHGLRPFLRKSGELGKAAIDLNVALERLMKL